MYEGSLQDSKSKCPVFYCMKAGRHLSQKWVGGSDGTGCCILATIRRRSLRDSAGDHMGERVRIRLCGTGWGTRPAMPGGLFFVLPQFADKGRAGQTTH